MQNDGGILLADKTLRLTVRPWGERSTSPPPRAVKVKMLKRHDGGFPHRFGRKWRLSVTVRDQTCAKFDVSAGNIRRGLRACVAPAASCPHGTDRESAAGSTDRVAHF